MFPNTEMPAYVSQAQERAKRGQQASKEQGDSQARAARRKWNRKGAKAEAGQAAKVENTEQAPSSSGKKKRKYTMSPEALEARRKAGVNARAVKARKMEESHLLTACDDSRLRSLSHQSAAIIGCAEVATIIEHLRSHALQSASSRVFVVAQVEYIRDLINEGRVEEAIKRLKMTAEAISQGEEGIC